MTADAAIGDNAVAGEPGAAIDDKMFEPACKAGATILVDGYESIGAEISSESKWPSRMPPSVTRRCVSSALLDLAFLVGELAVVATVATDRIELAGDSVFARVRVRGDEIISESK